MNARAEHLALIGGIPAASFVAGEGAAWLLRLPPFGRSALQHFAAGSVFAAIAVDLMPLVVPGSTVAVAVGIAAGALLSILLAHIGTAEREPGSRTLHVALLATVAIDVFLDGLLLGVASVQHATVGVSLAAALAVENFPLGLTIASHLRVRHPPGSWKGAVLAGLTGMLPVGMVVGDVVGARLSDGVFVGVLAFATAALLFLAAEELLVEAHETSEQWVTSGLLFLGFWMVLLLDKVT